MGCESNINHECFSQVIVKNKTKARSALPFKSFFERNMEKIEWMTHQTTKDAIFEHLTVGLFCPLRFTFCKSCAELMRALLKKIAHSDGKFLILIKSFFDSLRQPWRRRENDKLKPKLGLIIMCVDWLSSLDETILDTCDSLFHSAHTCWLAERAN